MVKVVGDLPFSPKRAYELIHTPNQPWATGETKDVLCSLLILLFILPFAIEIHWRRDPSLNPV